MDIASCKINIPRKGLQASPFHPKPESNGGMARSRRRTAFTRLIILLFFLVVAPAFAETIHEVHFKGTDSELDVYHIKGREPGPTLLLVGGIQGNEPGGYLAADLYADVCLKKGNMIVVPRANFLSIVTNQRGVRGDMNRKFAGSPGPTDRDVRVVEIIKALIKKSDYFLNLHDGSGFYSPNWESPLRNPNRYGQSVITDADVYVRKDGRVLRLGETAKKVVHKVNPRITETKHLFRFNNHRTLEKDSTHKEQRRSATFHALTKAGIPAFGVETSKSIPDYRLRVRYQTMVVNAFIDLFGIVLDNPNTYLDNPYLKYLIVSINGRTPIVVAARDVLRVQKGDRIKIVHIESNYSRGLVARVGGMGKRFNDLDQEITITKSTQIKVNKDRFHLATVPVEIMSSSASNGPAGIRFEPRVEYFMVRVNGATFAVQPGDEVAVTQGDVLVILDPKTNLDVETEKQLRIDLRGFQAESSPYPVEDRGHHINTGRDLIPKYGRTRAEVTIFPLQAKLNKSVIGQCYLAVGRPKLRYLVLRSSRGENFVVYPGEKIQLPEHEVIRIIDVRTNLSDSTPLFFTMSGKTIRWQQSSSAGIDASKLTEREVPLDIIRNDRSLGRIWLRQGKVFRLSSRERNARPPTVPVRY